MKNVEFSDHQIALIKRPIESKIFLEGPAGTGKTTAGVGRLLHLLTPGVPAETILVVVPQRTLATSYYKAFRPRTGSRRAGDHPHLRRPGPVDGGLLLATDCRGGELWLTEEEIAVVEANEVPGTCQVPGT